MSRAYDPVTDLERSIANAYVRADAAAELQRRLATVHGSGYDDEGLVYAVVSGTGALVDLKFHPAAASLGPTKLGEAIVAAARYAQIDVRQRAYTVAALVLGDEATAAVEAADSPVPARAIGWDIVSSAPAATEPVPAPVEPAPVVRTLGAEPAADDDLTTFDASVFRSDR